MLEQDLLPPLRRMISSAPQPTQVRSLPPGHLKQISREPLLHPAASQAATSAAALFSIRALQTAIFPTAGSAAAIIKICSMNGFLKGDGCDFSQSTFIASVLEKGTYCYGNFSNTLWKDSSIVQAKLCMAYLSDSKFKKLKFDQVDLTQAEFFHTSLKGVDLSGCLIEGITVSESFSELRGLKSTPHRHLILHYYLV